MELQVLEVPQVHPCPHSVAGTTTETLMLMKSDTGLAALPRAAVPMDTANSLQGVPIYKSPTYEA